MDSKSKAALYGFAFLVICELVLRWASPAPPDPSERWVPEGRPVSFVLGTSRTMRAVDPLVVEQTLHDGGFLNAWIANVSRKGATTVGLYRLYMDAFFASVEERDKPRLKGRPIVIGSDPKDGKGRGVVSTANYLARQYGIRSALPISRAWAYSQKAKAEGKPEAVFISPDIAKYAAESAQIFEYMKRKVDTLQVASIDEVYADQAEPPADHTEPK